MPKKEYSWRQGELPEIGSHSLAKHRILREYVGRYVQRLTSNPRIDQLRLALVDGFAGGGVYVDPRTRLSVPGSPQILLDAVEAARAVANATRVKPLRIDASFYFIEKDPPTVEFLRQTLRARPAWSEEHSKVTVLDGAFEERLEQIISAVSSQGRVHRCIFVLDQYGYTGVPVRAISRIFAALPRAEVFLTVAVGWIVAYLQSTTEAALKLGVPRATIDRMCRDGEEALTTGDAERRPDLAAIQRLLQKLFTSEGGARFYTPFFIISRESNRPYWLLHMANALRANDVVKCLHWEVENHFSHYGGPGLEMLGYDPARDPVVTGQEAFHFDDAAQVRMRDALYVELPRRIRTAFPQGVAFGHLAQLICNETPATEAHLAQAVSALCQSGELVKTGGQGERREAATRPHADDRIEMTGQRRLTF